MRNRDFFIPSITTLILSGMVWFLSCAHQNRFKDEENASFEQAAEQELADANNTTEQPAQDTNQVTPAESTPAKSDLELTSEKGDASNTALSEPQATTNENAPSTPTEESVAPQSEPSPEMAKAEPSLESNPESKPEPELVSPDPTPVTEASEAQVRESIEQELTGEITREAPRKRVSLRLPKIPSKAFSRRGSKLNRFYFVRQGDSPKKVSELIYSHSKFSKNLVRWNGKVWSPGQVIFYASPINPKDKRMASFYQEQNIQPEEYRVQGGDWLTRIAKKQLGSPKSWKEIAVLNGLKAPNSLEVGQTLALYPKNLLAPQPKTDYAQTAEEPRFQEAQPKMAEPSAAPTPSAPPIAEAQPTSPPPINQQVAPPPSQNPPASEPEKLDEVAPEQPTAAMDWNQIAEQNSIAILIGAALIILLLALAVRKKRQKTRSSSQNNGDSGSAGEETRSRFKRR